ncbi:MAG TPA: response regulator transcription factor [Alphaproteobacteria bacterium]|jgi:DNA-binding NarL/FixJ family response regulator
MATEDATPADQAPAEPSVLIADDHPLYRDALESLIRRAPGLRLAGAVTNLPEALMVLVAAPCDLVLLDLMMPGMNGVESLYKVHHLRPEAKIVLISGQMDRAIVTAGLAAGAVGFLSKACTPDTILAALRLVLTGASYVPSDLMWGEAPPRPPEAPGKPKPAAGDDAVLSDREIDVLHLLAEGASHKEIGRELGLAEVTIKLHTQRIVRKLGAKNRAAAIAMAVRDGLIRIHH